MYLIALHNLCRISVVRIIEKSVEHIVVSAAVSVSIAFDSKESSPNYRVLLDLLLKELVTIGNLELNQIWINGGMWNLILDKKVCRP